MQKLDPAYSARMNDLKQPSLDRPLPPPEPVAALPLSRSKFHPPLSSRGRVPRERLLTMLEQQADVQAVLLLAPSGYGKTTLMGQWMERIAHADGHAAWLTLDEADNDPARLMCSFYGALREWMAHALGSSEALAAFAAADWLFLLDRIGSHAPPFTLFLDEFEQLTIAPALQLATMLVGRLPRQVRLVIASRDKPPLVLESYRALGELLELTAAHLRFDFSETQRFFTGRSTDPPAPWVIEKMQSITGGWPAALQFVALATYWFSRHGTVIEAVDLWLLAGEGGAAFHDLPMRAALPAPSCPILSERERAILKLLATGMGNEQIATCVFLSVNTVKWHIRRILEKFEARNRSEAVFIARQLGLIDV